MLSCYVSVVSLVFSLWKKFYLICRKASVAACNHTLCIWYSTVKYVSCIVVRPWICFSNYLCSVLNIAEHRLLMLEAWWLLFKFFWNVHGLLEFFFVSKIFSLHSLVCMFTLLCVPLIPASGATERKFVFQCEYIYYVLISLSVFLWVFLALSIYSMIQHLMHELHDISLWYCSINIHAYVIWILDRRSFPSTNLLIFMQLYGRGLLIFFFFLFFEK